MEPAEFELATAPAGAPKAAVDQFDVQPWEYGLLALARRDHPNVSWWHGYRHIDGGWVSQCYVCEVPVVSWPGGGSPPTTARQQIAVHKQQHRDGVWPAAVQPSEGENA